MKKWLLGTLALVLTQSCKVTKDGDINSVFTGSGKTIVAEGPLVERTLDLDFNAIRVASSMDIEVQKADKEKVVVLAPENLQKVLVIDVRNGELIFDFKPNTNLKYTDEQLKIKVYARDFNQLTTNSSGDIEVLDEFSAENMQIKTSSSGDISGNFKAKNLQINTNSSGDFSGNIVAQQAELKTSSAGDIEVSGKVEDLNATASSSGDISAKDLEVDNAKLKSSSAGDISVTVTKSAEAFASSAGDIAIYRKGNPEISKRESSAGSVIIY